MKTLIIANNSAGLYAFRKELLVELINKSEVYIAVPKGVDLDRLIDMGCVFIETKLDRHGTNPFSDALLIKRYLSIINEVKPDVVLTYTVKPNIYGGIACQIKHVPYISNITGLGTSMQGNNFLQRVVTNLYRIGLKKAKVVFFQNSDNQKKLIDSGIVNGRSVLLPGSGVNLEKNPVEPYPSSEDEIVFLIIGRIMKDKGIDEVLSAAAEVKKEYPQAVFRILGTYEDDYKDIIEAAVQNGTIEYLGYKDNVHDYIANSHATINASYHEGMSNVVLETASAGRPVIASDIPGCKEAVIDGVTGLLFPPKDTPSLVSTIKQFINLNHEEKEMMGIRGRKKMELEFDRRIVVDKYLEEIDMAIRK